MSKNEITIGDKAPDFCLPDSENNNVCLRDFKGKWTVLYFYPRDGTKGCTLEALTFTANKKDFEDLGAEIIGVSPDSPESHIKFIEKNELGITLLSDVEHGVMKKFGVWQLKKMYGREFYGVVRSTFLLDHEGKVVHLWRKVRVKGHVDAVKDKLAALSSK